VRVDIDDQIEALRYIGGTSARGIEDVLTAARLIPPLSSRTAKALADSPELTDATSKSLASVRTAALPPFVRNSFFFDSSWDITPPVPMIWALNTDGFDFAGVNVSVTNCSGESSICCTCKVSYARELVVLTPVPLLQ
jgi:hypothetical protein